jgi:hypothetical protein
LLDFENFSKESTQHRIGIDITSREKGLPSYVQFTEKPEKKTNSNKNKTYLRIYTFQLAERREPVLGTRSENVSSSSTVCRVM